jgi:CspA family cold shock protein
MKGTVKRWLFGRGYGFIKPDEGEDEVFVHHSEVSGVRDLEEGQRVEFEIEASDRGPRAVKVTLAE